MMEDQSTFADEDVITIELPKVEGEPKMSRADLDKAIARLAAMDTLDYERARKEEAKRLEMRPAVLDKLVQAARPQSQDEDDGGLGLIDPEPWPDEVDGESLLDEIVAGIARYVVMPPNTVEATALWVVHCFAFECWQHSPRLSVTAPEKGCGKSTLLDVLAFLTPRSVKTENMSSAVMFRLMDAYRPTLLVDEVDTFLTGKNADEDLRGALNAGHARGGKHLRCEGDNHEVKAFKTFGPAALAGIGRLPGTLADRSVPVVLQRRGPDEYVQNFRGDRAGHLRETARKAARWVADNESRLRGSDPALPAGIYNRDADNWRTLLSIADAVGGKWPELARSVATALTGANMDNESIGVRLLSDMRDIFATVGDDRITSKELAEKLHEIEDAPWPEYGRGQKPITPVQVARLLKPFCVSPGPHRNGGAVVKGYRLNDALKRAFSLYLPPQGVTRLQPSNSASYSDFQTVTPSADVTARKPENSRVSAGCDGVTAQKGGNGAIDTVPPIEKDSGPESEGGGPWSNSI